MKRALITGITGQDGSYLADLLLRKGYKVYGTYRRLSTPNFWRLQYLKRFEEVNLLPADLADTTSLFEVLKTSEPDEVYHLAAQSFVQASFETPVATGDITGLSVTRLLESVRQFCPSAKVYFAATSEMYGQSGIKGDLLTEDDPFQPMSPYAVAKLYGFWITKIYREAYKLYTVNGILFNHESPIRGLEFVSRKITNEVAKISLGYSKELRLGNLDARRDWGWTPEYVASMWLMLQQDEPDDYVIATGETHTVRELAKKAFDYLGMNWEEYVKTDRRFMRPLDLPCIRGDSSKARRTLGWSARVRFEEIVKRMVDAEVDRWRRYSEGETFPWDAPNYPNENKVLTRISRI